MSGLVDSIFGGGNDAPAPDPAIGQANLKLANNADQALQFYTNVYNNDIRPYQQQLNPIALESARVGLQDQQNASQFAQQQRDQYNDLYAPLERQSVADAENYDSAANVNARMGLAHGNVQQAFDNARAESVRQLQKYGLNPNSGAFAATNARLTGQQALADAGQQTGAAFDTMDRGIALRAGAVQTGRGLTNSAAQSLTSGAQAGSAGINAANNTAQGNVAGAGVGGAGYSVANQALGTGGNLMLGQYQGQLGAYNSSQEKQGAVLGAGIGLAGALLSSKKFKDRNEVMDPQSVLDKVKGLRVDSWSYKGDPQRHIGPYAEDLHQKFGVGDGQTIGPTDNGGIALLAVKGLAEDLDQIKAAMGIQPKARGLRVQ